MRTITSAAAAAAGSASASPVLILKLSLASGDIYFATRELSAPITAEARIVSCSPTEMLCEKSSGSSRFTVTLADHDLTLKSIFDSEPLAGRAATLYQYFETLSEADLIPLASGIVSEDAIWHEKDRKLILKIKDGTAIFRDLPVGRIATKKEFSKLGAGEEGKTLPLIFGAPHRVSAVLVKSGARTELVKGITATDTEIIVKNAKDFPTGAIAIRIRHEEIEGSFNGNTFTVTGRGRITENATVTHLAGRTNYVGATSLALSEDNVYVGLFARATVDGRQQVRRITGFTASTGTLRLAFPFVDSSGHACNLPVGTSFEIISIATGHLAGEEVHEALDGYVYLISDASLTAVDAIEGFGTIEPKVSSGGTLIQQKREGQIPIPPQYYRINLNDTTTFPALGRAVATVTMRRLPTHIPELNLTTDRLWLSARGYPLAGGTVMDNPADIIQHLLTEHAGVFSADIDPTSFAAAKAARSNVKMAFSMAAPKPVSEAVNELAFQARLALFWEGGKAKLHALSNSLGTPAQTITRSTLEHESTLISGSLSGDIVTSITAKYTHRGEKAAVAVSDSTAETTHGKRQKTISFWAFESRHQVLAAAEWWLRRWRHRYRVLQISTFLPGIALERLDTVTLDYPLLFTAPASGRITRIDHEPGHPRDGEIDRINLTIELPQWSGCASSCEHSCETSACETSGCELSCTASCETSCEWTCETSCEEACQLTCTANCELACEATCMVSCRSGAESTSCSSACESGCETSCESEGCETGCESCCEVNCEAAATETISPVRQVKVVNGPASQYGSLSVVQCDREGNEHCAAFTAYDPFDVAPAAGDKATVYLNFNYQWVIVPNRREAKYVRVQSNESGDLYNVIEQDHEGNTWGGAFLAYAVDSV